MAKRVERGRGERERERERDWFDAHIYVGVRLFGSSYLSSVAGLDREREMLDAFLGGIGVYLFMGD